MEKVKENLNNIGVLTPTQTGELLMQLYKARFKKMPDGSVDLDQKTDDLITSIANSARDAFGTEWDLVYSEYKKGQDALLRISDLINLNPNATATEKNKQIEKILRLSQSKVGRLLIKESIDDFKLHSGIDLSSHISAIQKIHESEQSYTNSKKNNFLRKLWPKK